MENNELNQENETVVLEAKVQTIFYETGSGEMTKYHHVSDKRINNKQAEELLQEQGFDVNIVLRVLTERISVEITRKELQDRITHSERFYQKQK